MCHHQVSNHGPSTLESRSVSSRPPRQSVQGEPHNDKFGTAAHTATATRHAWPAAPHMARKKSQPGDAQTFHIQSFCFVFTISLSTAGDSRIATLCSAHSLFCFVFIFSHFQLTENIDIVPKNTGVSVCVCVCVCVCVRSGA